MNRVRALLRLFRHAVSAVVIAVALGGIGVGVAEEKPASARPASERV